MTTYTNVFGGNTIKPADVSYTTLALTSNLTLSWPGEGGSYSTSAIVEVTPNASGRTLKMPSALRVAPGESVTFKNLGSDSFALQDSAGGSIVTVAAGTAYTVYLRSNATAAGTWSYWQAGAGSSSTDAGALDGAGLEAASGLLRVTMQVGSYTSPQAFSDSDRGSVAVWTGGSGTFTVPTAASVGEGWFMHFKNDGSGTLTIASSASETFSGSSTVTLVNGQSAVVTCDGTNFIAIVAASTAATSTFDYTAISVAGTGTYTLSAAEYAKNAIKFTGILTGARTIVVPTGIRDYWISNATTGAFSLTVKTAAGTGIVVTQGKAATLYADGVNVVSADTDYPSGISTPVSIADGGTGAITADLALTALGGTTTGKQVFTAANAAAIRSAAVAAASGANTDITSVYLNNTGLKIKDTNASHGLSIVPGSDITADRVLTVTTGDADRTLTMSANLTVSGAATVSQDYSTTGNPQFATIEVGAAADTTLSRSSAGVLAVEGVTVPLNAITATHTALQVELGHASDTTLARASAGVMSVEGKHVPSPASQAQGDVLYHNGTTWARLGAGTSGQYLKTLGTGANPAWADASGAWTLIGTYTASSSATLGVTGLSGYKAIRITVCSIKPATDAANLKLEFSNDNGSTHGVQTDTQQVQGSSAGTITSGSGTTTDRYVALSVTSAAGEAAINGVITITNFNVAARAGFVSQLGYQASGAGTRLSLFYATINNTTARDALRFAFSTGNIASGNIVVEGIAG